MRKWMLWTGGGLLVAFVGVAVWQYVVAQGRFEQNADLVAELATAEFLDDEPLSDGDWPQWRGRRRDGHALAFPMVESWPKRGPDRAWEIELGEGWSTPVVAGGRVYYFFRHDGDEVVRCVEIDSGKQLWQHRYPVAVNIEYSNGPRSTPCVAGDKLYTVGVTGRVQCRRTSDGGLVWEKDLQQVYAVPVPHRGHSASPLVEGDSLILNPGIAGASVVAWRAADGKEIWKAGSDPVGYSSPLVTTLAGRKVVVLFTGTALTGWGFDDGRALFSFPWPTGFQINASTPLLFRTRQGTVVRHYAFISTGYKQGFALLHLRPRDDGTIAIDTVYKGDGFCSHFGTPVRIGDTVYGFDEARLAGFDLRTGEVKWRRTGFSKGTLCAVGDQLVVFGEQGEVGVGPATRDEPFEPTLSARIFRERCWSMPVVADGRLLLRTEDAGVCLDLRKR